MSFACVRYCKPVPTQFIVLQGVYLRNFGCAVDVRGYSPDTLFFSQHPLLLSTLGRGMAKILSKAPWRYQVSFVNQFRVAVFLADFFVFFLLSNLIVTNY